MKISQLRNPANVTGASIIYPSETSMVQLLLGVVEKQAVVGSFLKQEVRK